MNAHETYNHFYAGAKLSDDLNDMVGSVIYRKTVNHLAVVNAWHPFAAEAGTLYNFVTYGIDKALAMLETELSACLDFRGTRQTQLPLPPVLL